MTINPFDILKNAQKIQEQIGPLKDKLAAIRVTGVSGGGMVELDMNGQMELTDVRISAEAMDMQDRDLLQELIKAAHMSGMEKIRSQLGRELGSMTGMPGMADILGAQ
ncbi:nucleoid-associated protein [Spirochaetia bacterium]|nr:nucleoid-associated protein [Spirochaetia bacterium]